MDLFHGIAGLRSLPPRTVLSVGNFDGIHLGHRQILSTMQAIAAERGAAGLTVVTFEPHPLTVLRPDLAPPRLTPSGLKQELLAAGGVDHLVILPPEPEVLNLEAEAFWQILRDEVAPVVMVEGATFNFGKGRRGTIQRLRQWSAQSRVQLVEIEPILAVLTGFWQTPVSSSMIRWLLGHGRARDAAICLGRPHVLEGTVVKGFQRGRALGIPTANLDCGDQMVPLEGVYAARCTLDGVAWPVALSIGTMPTFGEHQRQVEAHLLDFSADLYGQTLRVEVLDWLRDQWRFPNIEGLQAQMALDLEHVRQRQALHPERPLAVLQANAH
jgi:riboflavin kinase/FMN adenylyltransferase